MKYATWNLKEEEPNYFSGPEGSIAEAGAFAEASDWFTGIEPADFEILGYIYGEFTADLSKWNFTELTEEQALAFAQSLDNGAFVGADGRIVTAEA